MVLNEPKIVGRTLRRQGIAALHLSNGASDLEGANPLAPPIFRGEETICEVHYTVHRGLRLSTRVGSSTIRRRILEGRRLWRPLEGSELGTGRLPWLPVMNSNHQGCPPYGLGTLSIQNRLGIHHRIYELNDTLKKPTPRSNGLRQGFGSQELRGIYGFLPFGTGCRPTRCFFRTLQQPPSPRLRRVKSYRE